MVRRVAPSGNDPSAEDAREMTEIHQLVDLARDLTEEIVDLAGVLLKAGADIHDTHREYVVPTLDLLTDVETRALLAATGDREAREALEGSIARLEHLRKEVLVECARHTDGERE
jgi:hypothetical protein